MRGHVSARGRVRECGDEHGRLQAHCLECLSENDSERGHVHARVGDNVRECLQIYYTTTYISYAHTAYFIFKMQYQSNDQPTQCHEARRDRCQCEGRYKPYRTLRNPDEPYRTLEGSEIPEVHFDTATILVEKLFPYPPKTWHPPHHSPPRCSIQVACRDDALLQHTDGEPR